MAYSRDSYYRQLSALSGKIKSFIQAIALSNDKCVSFKIRLQNDLFRKEFPGQITDNVKGQKQSKESLLCVFQ